MCRIPAAQTSSVNPLLHSSKGKNEDEKFRIYSNGDSDGSFGREDDEIRQDIPVCWSILKEKIKLNLVMKEKNKHVTFSLRARSANVLGKGLVSKYFRFCMPWDLCHNHSSLPG